MPLQLEPVDEGRDGKAGTFDVAARIRDHFSLEAVTAEMAAVKGSNVIAFGRPEEVAKSEMSRRAPYVAERLGDSPVQYLRAAARRGRK